MTKLEKAQRYAIGECLSDFYDDYSFDQICEMLNDYDLNQDQYGDTIIFPIEALEHSDVVFVMREMVKAYMRGAE